MEFRTPSRGPPPATPGVGATSLLSPRRPPRGSPPRLVLTGVCSVRWGSVLATRCGR